jgi:hypothetical protein
MDVERIFAHRLECEIRMESTISTKDLKSKLDQKQVTVVETLAPERYREAHIPGALNIPPERIKGLAPQLLPKQGRRDHHLLHEQSLTRQRIRCP